MCVCVCVSSVSPVGTDLDVKDPHGFVILGSFLVQLAQKREERWGRPVCFVDSIPSVCVCVRQDPL